MDPASTKTGRSREDRAQRKRLRVITPTLANAGFAAMVKAIEGYSCAAYEVEHVFLDRGPPSVDSYINEALAGPDTLRKVVDAQRDGVDGILINCVGDPALFAVREAASVPVLTTGQTSLHVAAILGQNIGFLDVLESCRTMAFDQAARYGLRDRLVSFRAVEIGVLHIERDVASVARRLSERAERAVREDGADVLVLGCGAFVSAVPLLKELLLERQVHVPIIDPLPISVRVLAAVVEAGLSHSKRAFPMPADLDSIFRA